MARVPTYDSFQVGAEVLPQPRMQSPVAMDTAGQQARQMGAALGNTGNELAKMALDMQRQINQVRVDEALNKAKETALQLTFDKDSGYTMLKGNKALERLDGKSLEQEYGDQLQRSIDGIAAGLGNDAQRNEFLRHATGMAASFRGDVLKHATQEYVTHAMSIAEGVQATAMREIALNYDKPEVIDKAVLRIHSQVMRQAELAGKSAEWQEAARRRMTSEAHKLAVKTALERGNLDYAANYMRKYEGQLDADDYLALQGTLVGENDLRTGTAMGAGIGQILVAPGGGSIDRVFPYLLQQESGNRQVDKSGKVITSSAGALGAAQIMPGTGPEAAKLAGLPWDANRMKTDYQYNTALGRAYLNEQYRQFGSVPLALAAYNAGPGAVRSALKKAGASGNWLAHLPAETQNYVASITGRMRRAASQAPMPTAADVEQSIRANPALAANPRMAEYARKEAERQIKVAKDTAKQQGEEAEAQAIQLLTENGGRYSDLPLSVREAIPSDKVAGVMNTAERIAKGDNVTNHWLYNELTARPEKLGTMTDVQFVALRKELNESDFKHFAKVRAERLGQGEGGARKLDTGALNGAVNQWLQTMRLDPTPKEGSADAAHVAGLRRFVLESAAMRQMETGKPMDEVAAIQFVHSLLSQDRTVRGWFSSSSVPLGKMRESDISDDTRARIKAALYRRGNTNPTDADILNVYYHLGKK